MGSFLNAILNRIISFGSKRITVVHTIGFDASAANAFEICKNYADFIRLMLSPDGTDPKPKWLNGKPGEVGAALQYTLVRDGSENVIVEKIAQLSADPATGACTLAWEQLSSQPQLPLRNYGCTWVLTPEPGTPDQPRCRLTWTRHFDEPFLFGILSLAAFMKRNFERSALPIMNDVFRPYYRRTFPSGPRTLPRKQDKVLVVGAGPSGLHMAHLLRNKLGVQNITIVERTERYGGKTLSVPDQTHPGIIHELGTCYLHPAYFAVRSLIEELQQRPHCTIGDEVAPQNYCVRKLGEDDMTLEEWVTSKLQLLSVAGLWWLLRLLPSKISTPIALLRAKATYNALHASTLGTYNFSLPPRPTPEALNTIDMSFGQLLESRGLDALVPILAYGQTCQGYGSIENTPAFWAMCWITPELLDGYFALHPQFPKKSMLRTGWGSLWDTIVAVNKVQIEFHTSVDSIHRPEDGPIVVKTSHATPNGRHDQTREFDYLVVAAPLLDPMRPQDCFMALTREEASLLRSAHLTSGQFRTILFRLADPLPYLSDHLNLDSDKILGPEVGQGDVFASRDSYLALHPELCTPKGHQTDPARNQRREQMAYQYVETGRNMPEADLDRRFSEWARDTLGNEGPVPATPNPTPNPNNAPPPNYDVVMRSPAWTYFQRFDRQGLLSSMPWRVLEMQGKNRTLFVHASTFFESVLDIVNMNNMLIDGLSGNLDTLDQPRSDKKPLYYQMSHWQLFYNGVVRLLLIALDIVIGVPWTIAYLFLRPLMEPFVRMSRKYLQTAFHTKDPGPWWRFNMSHFLKVSPSVRCYIDQTEDPVVTLGKPVMARDYPEVPKVTRALEWSFADYRVGVRVWQSLVDARFLTFIGPRMKSFLTRFTARFPVLYNYLFSWFACVAFNNLTGYGVRVEDQQGGGCYVPHCTMLAVARKEYGEDLGNRICTRVCKIFTEEEMAGKGMPCVLEPNPDKGSCMIRGVNVRKTAFSDHSTAWWLSNPLVQIKTKEKVSA